LFHFIISILCLPLIQAKMFCEQLTSSYLHKAQGEQIVKNLLFVSLAIHGAPSFLQVRC
jgi:hypothetical protein